MNWKEIKGYEGLYSINDQGRILSHRRTGARLHFLKPYRSGHTCREYLAVSLCMNNKRKRCRVNRLVAEHFIPNPHNHKIVQYKNGNRYDNRAVNLEWASYSENNKRNRKMQEAI